MWSRHGVVADDEWFMAVFAKKVRNKTWDNKGKFCFLSIFWFLAKSRVDVTRCSTFSCNSSDRWSIKIVSTARYEWMTSWLVLNDFTCDTVMRFRSDLFLSFSLSVSLVSLLTHLTVFRLYNYSNHSSFNLNCNQFIKYNIKGVARHFLIL